MGPREFLFSAPGAGRWNALCCIQVRIAATAFDITGQRDFSVAQIISRISAMCPACCLMIETPCVSVLGYLLLKFAR